MRIYDTNTQPSGVAAGQSREASRISTSEGKIGSASQGRAAAKTDEVQLSGVGAQMSAAAEGPEREARVAELAAMYKAGNYKVDAEKVSARLIDDSITAR